MQARSAKSIWAFVLGLSCPYGFHLLGLFDLTSGWWGQYPYIMSATEHAVMGTAVTLLLRPRVSMFSSGVAVGWALPSVAKAAPSGFVLYWAVVGVGWGACALLGELIGAGALSIARRRQPA